MLPLHTQSSSPSRPIPSLLRRARSTGPIYRFHFVCFVESGHQPHQIHCRLPEQKSVPSDDARGSTGQASSSILGASINGDAHAKLWWQEATQCIRWKTQCFAQRRMSIAVASRRHVLFTCQCALRQTCCIESEHSVRPEKHKLIWQDTRTPYTQERRVCGARHSPPSSVGRAQGP